MNRIPEQSLSSLSKSFSFSRRSVRRILDEIGYESKSIHIVHEIMAGQEPRQLERAKKLLDWRQGMSMTSINSAITFKNFEKVIVWTDEKLFVVVKAFHRHNSRVIVPIKGYDPTLHRVRRCKDPQSVMVFLAVASDGHVMPPIILEAGLRINSAVYQYHVLCKLIPWIRSTWVLGQVVLMQNGAPAHTSASTQNLLAMELGADGFWSKEMWPPSSPDCNPLDFSFWTALATTVGDTASKNRAELISRLQERWRHVLHHDYVVKT